MLGIFLASIAASIANVIVFGPVTETQFVVNKSAEGTTQGFRTTTQYGSGPFSTVLGLAILVPFLSSATRRLHDIGRSGWHLAIPWLAAFGLLVLVLVGFLENVPINDEFREMNPSIGETISVPQPPIALFLLAWLSWFVLVILSIVWLARRSQPGPNEYGPNPHEVTS